MKNWSCIQLDCLPYLVKGSLPTRFSIKKGNMFFQIYSNKIQTLLEIIYITPTKHPTSWSLNSEHAHC